MISLYIICDYEVEGEDDFYDYFKVIEVRDANGTDYTFVVDPEKVYFSLPGVRADIAEKLQIDMEELELEQV